MSVKIGTTNFDDFKIGSTQITKIYAGATKIWENEVVLWSGSATGTVTTKSVTFGPSIAQVSGEQYKLTGNYEVTNGTNVKIDVRDYLQSGTFINIASANTGDTGTFTKTINSSQTRNRQLFQARYNNGAYTIKLTNVKLVKL